MTVTYLDLSSSRAGSLPLVGGNLALDFANTESGRGSESHRNHLSDATNVLDWLNHVNALPAGATEWLRAEVSTRPALADELVARSIALRAAIHAVGAAIGRGGAPSHASLARLSELHAESIARAALAFEGDICRWRWSLSQAPVDAALGPIALAAVDLFTDADFSRIKQCAGQACGWLFYDSSKNKRRRWCEMDVCGNRAKQKRFAARRRRT
jgi:predicted RNA-binding Zn ribbon-like protein